MPKNIKNPKFLKMWKSLRKWMKDVWNHDIWWKRKGKNVLPQIFEENLWIFESLTKKNDKKKKKKLWEGIERGIEEKDKGIV